MHDLVGALEDLYRDAHEALHRRHGRPAPARCFRVDFYPYAGLRSTIFDRGGFYDVRLGDLLRTAPVRVQYELACLLLGRIDRRLRLRADDVVHYRAWARSPEVLADHDRLRGLRGRKRFLPARGTTHDLEAMFHRLNAEYFQGRLATPRLGWSLRRGRRYFGHQDAAHDAIVINRALDSPRVPPFVVENVLHHEMLHQVHGVTVSKRGRRVVHPAALRWAERRFPRHGEAKDFLDRVAGRRIRL